MDGRPIDVSSGVVLGVRALDALWADLPSAPIIVDWPDAEGVFGAAVCRLMVTEGGPVDGADVVATHGARNATTHALASLAPSSPVYHSADDEGAALPILRSGHRPIAVGTGALFDRAARDGRCGVVVPLPAQASGALTSACEWEALIDLAARQLVVLDDTYGFLDGRPRPLAAFVGAGGVVVGSLRLRLGAPGLRVGWLLAGGELADLARESMRCESRGVAPMLLDVAARAVDAAVVAHVGDEVRLELHRRRSDLRDSIAPDLEAALVVGDGSLYAWIATSLRGVPGLAVHRGRGRLRLCLGAYGDFREVAARLEVLRIRL